MADKITDEQVAALLACLRPTSNLTIDAKVTKVNAVKSGIKQHNVPDTCIPQLFEALRVASATQHAALANAGFTALNHLLTRLSRQEPRWVIKEAGRTLPLVVEKMGDQKDKFRQLALQSLSTMFAIAPALVEAAIREKALSSKNPRAKESAMQWVLEAHQQQGLQFKIYVPQLVELLEDADGMVRDTARRVVIGLFEPASNAAKADLKKQLKSAEVRPSIAESIIKDLNPQARPITPAFEPEEQEAPVRASQPTFGASVSAATLERPITPAVDESLDAIEPIFVNTSRELDETFRDLAFPFEGKETEHNWVQREKNIRKMRRLVAGNASEDHTEHILGNMKNAMDGVIKCISSLRTSMQIEGCRLVQDMARKFGPAMDLLVEAYMQALLKLGAATKKIAQQIADETIDVIISKVSYSNRILNHVTSASADKNIGPRLFAAGWLRTLLSNNAHHVGLIEHNGGVDMIEKSIRRGLGDANPGVREKMRATYWTYAGIWPTRASAMMGNLDPQAQKQLEKDAHNPNASRQGAITPRPGLGFSKSTISASKPTLKEALLAQKRAVMQAKNLPARPGSAMAHFSPVRTVSNSSDTSTATTTTTASTRPRPESRLGGAGGLSGAPVRPVRRRPEMRPELAPRPATAGPYSVRGGGGEQTSPPLAARPRAAVTPKTISSSPKRTAARPRPGMGHKLTTSESSIPVTTPARYAPQPSGMRPAVEPSPRAASPLATPVRPRLAPAMTAPANSTTAAKHMTMPDLGSLHMPPSSPQSPQSPQRFAASRIPEPSTTPRQNSSLRGTPVKTVQVYEDPFVEDPQPPSVVMSPVLEERPVNEDAAKLMSRANTDGPGELFSPEKSRQNLKLLGSAMSKIRSQSLDVHGFRKLQGILRDTKGPLPDETFNALVDDLFAYLKSQTPNTAPEKVQDTKTQIIATLKLLLKKYRESFVPHVSSGLESLLDARAAYDGRNHIGAAMEMLADELVAVGDAQEITTALTQRLAHLDSPDLDSISPSKSVMLGSSTPTSRSLSMGLHILTQLLDTRPQALTSDTDVRNVAALCHGCLEASDSAVRNDAVQLCVILHAKIGDARFWGLMGSARDDPKSLITYFIVKRQKELGLEA